MGEEQCRSLEVSFERTKERTAQDEERDATKLDNARRQLQRSLSDASEAHGKEVGRLEDEIMAERQRVSHDALAEQACIDQITQLEQARSKLEKERGLVGTQSHQDAGRCAALGEELKHVRAEVQIVENRTAGLQ